MAPALQTPHFASPSPQGVGARLVRRLGGAVRKTIAGGVTLAGALRRPAASQPRIGHPVVRNADVCPACAPEPRARRPHAAPPAPSQPRRPVWLTRLLHRRCRQPAPSGYGQFAADNNAPFTLEEFPGLLPEACAFFNTPLEDLDPEILPRLLGVFAEKIVHLIPPELGITDPQELFSDLWDRLGAPLYGALPGVPADAEQDAPLATPVRPSPAEQIASPHPLPHPPSAVAMVSPDPLPEASSHAPAPAIPNTPLALPHPSPEPSPPAPTGPLAGASFLSPPSPPDAPAAEPPHHAPITAAASETAAHAASMLGPVSRGDTPVLNRGGVLLCRIESACQRHGRFLRRAFFHRSPLRTLPSRHWCYAARASPACG